MVMTITMTMLTTDDDYDDDDDDVCMHRDGRQRYGGEGIVPVMAPHIDLSMHCFLFFIMHTMPMQIHFP